VNGNSREGEHRARRREKEVDLGRMVWGGQEAAARSAKKL